MRDDVVQLTGDPHPLLTHPTRRLPFPVLLRTDGPGGVLGLQLPPRTHHFTQQQRHQRPQHLQYRQPLRVHHVVAV
ncbi:hypothetical protein [Streptomyces sp. NBC_00286]|uniref:hypothetical protein n=1 Tax=Streptomyces sp. NBC_00286 TaxID=2975701 RepID=UPI002E2A7552|nr:hypothetical protein [Streptomyces sp. NBC_00286]